MIRSIRLWLGTALVAFALSGAIVIYFTAQDPVKAESRIGGPFELVNTEGETVTDEDFEGQYTLIYFGYTYCPDVCPTTLLHITRALNLLEESAPAKVEKITPIFITVDPERDTVEQMRTYVTNFHPSLVGLTGNDEQIAKVARRFKVTYWRVKGGVNSEYTMAHSGYTFVMGPDGDYIDRFDHRVQAKEIADAMDTLIEG
ncbi:SCO family protein [Ferruginivarius sediminum]|uniref:SCO family protein n=1 Tax=Ferruginivarius sediminum TaxID=2661937 RepID=A0A369TBC8_9PROT|nr:SCO family protein [Ferruginivarius sediminum]RDD62641.1 SCO family protein [Ferruginivarius sediminum]